MNSNSLLTQRNKGGHLFIIITYIFLSVSLVCLIINYSVDRTINWSLFPIGALMVLIITISPLLLMNKYRLPVSYAGLTISIILYLFLIQSLVPEKGWFIALGLPVALLSLVAFGLSLAAFTLFRSNKLYAAAITVFLFGVVVTLGIDLIVNNFMKDMNLKDGSRIFTVGGSVITALVLVIVGNIRSTNARNRNQGINK